MRPPKNWLLHKRLDLVLARAGVPSLMSHSIEIRTVETAADWKAFYRVKCDLYRDDPAAVIPLRKMEYALLDDQKHPFYQHAQRQAFLAVRDGRPIGRIVAIKDDMHNEHYSDRVGFFGFFESPHDDEVAGALLDAAKAWLLERGLNIMRGPVNPSMKSEFGVLVEGNEYPPFVMMGHTPRYYASLLEAYGLSVVRRFFAFILDSRKAVADGEVRLKKMRKVTDRITKRISNVRIEQATQANIEQVMREINVLGNEVRSEGWGFVPLTEAELDFMVSQVKRIVDPKTVFLAYINDELAAYNVAIPDINWAVRRAKGPDWLRMPQLLFWISRIPRVRAIALGAAKKFRHTGIASLICRELTEQMSMYDEWEFSWIIEENLLSMAAMNRCVPTTRYKIYHLYEAPISAATHSP